MSYLENPTKEFFSLVVFFEFIWRFSDLIITIIEITEKASFIGKSCYKDNNISNNSMKIYAYLIVSINQSDFWLEGPSSFPKFVPYAKCASKELVLRYL